MVQKEKETFYAKQWHNYFYTKAKVVFMDIQSLLLGEEDWSFLPEAAFRTLVMFTVILIGLRLLGKRGIRQLSVFELGVIIGLGSAAGDPMFYKDVGLLPGMLVFVIVVGMYKMVTNIFNRNPKFEKFMEGEPATILSEGVLQLHKFKKEPIALDELYTELRLRNVSHLGQLRQAIIETNGEVSMYFYKNEEVKWGLPIIPEDCAFKQQKINYEHHYACNHCGNVQLLPPAARHECKLCGKDVWLKAQNHTRIT